MQPVHIDPFQAVEAHVTLQARTSLGIHFGVFELTDEGPLAPKLELQRALEAADVPREQFWVLELGEARVLDP